MNKRRRARSTRGRKGAKKEHTAENEEDVQVMPGRSAQPAGSETAEKQPETKPTNGLDITGWSVATTGLFMLRSRSELDSALKQRGADVTQSVSKRSTHLILGSRSDENLTGVGSPDHTKAVEFGVPIIGEKELWEMILPDGMTFSSPAHIQDSDTVQVPADPDADADEDVDEKKEVKSEDQPTPVVTKWRLFLIGVFVSMSRAELEGELNLRGNAVSHMVTAKTTHLVVGGKTSTNYNGVRNGVGSFKYNEAKELGIPIIREKDLIAMLGIELNEVNPVVEPQGVKEAVSGDLNQEVKGTSGRNGEKNKDGASAFNGEGWRLVLVGDFGVRPREQLESELTRHGAAVLKARTGCTSHIVLGSKGETNEYTFGSSEYKVAIANGITIISEEEIWAKLAHGRDDSVAQAKTSTQADNLKDEANPASSAMENGNTIMKSEAAKLTISPVSVKAKIQAAKIAPDEIAVDEVQDSAPRSATQKEAKTEDIAPTPVEVDEPLDGHFPNFDANDGKPTPAPQLDAKSKKLAEKKKEQKKATGKARCRACHKMIEKGTTQVKLRDSLLFSTVGGNGRYEMFLEDDGTFGRSSIGVNTFWVHDDAGCREEAQRKCNMQLEADVDEINEHRRTLLDNE